MNDGRRMTVRLGDFEAEVIRSIAEALDVTDSEAVRLAITALADKLPAGVGERLEGPPVPSEVVEMRDALDRLVLEVRRVGVNINQIVRMAHVNGWTDDDLPGLLPVPGVLDGLVDVVTGAVRDVG